MVLALQSTSRPHARRYGSLSLAGLGIMAVLLSNRAFSMGDLGPECDKACLSDLAERYLDAKSYGDPGLLPLASGLRVTSNSEAAELGEGETWQPGITIVNRHTFVDPRTQTAIFFGTIAGKPEENRDWWHYAVRLTVDSAGDIHEIEEQSTQLGFQTADKVEVPFKESAIFDAVLPEDERVGEYELIRAADSYWDGLTTGDGEDVLFGPDCQRTEFGKYSTNATQTHPRDADPEFVSEPKTGKSCRMFFDGPKFRWTTENRRYYIADEARGVVVGIGQLRQFGEEGHPGLTLIEAFKVVNGRIDFLWAPAFNWGVEDSGWPDWERPKH